MTNPKISVVLTAHPEYDKYLLRALESYANQSFKDFELIVAYDDKLTDVANKINDYMCQAYPQLDLKWLPGKKFGSHPYPKNRGTKAAKGEYIVYADADCAARKDKLAALYREILRSGVDCVYGDRMIINQDNPKKREPGVKSEFSLSLLGKENFIDTNDVLVRRSAVLAVGGWDEELKYFADWNLWVRMAKAGFTFKHLSLTISDYYWHTKNNVLKSHEAAKQGKLTNFDVQGCTIWPAKTLFGRAPQPKVAIFMLTMNRLTYTIETITSMYEKASYPFDLYIIDQGSTDKTPIWLADNEKKYGFKYKALPANVGISKGSNMALEWIMNGKPVLHAKADSDRSVKIVGTVDHYQIIGKVDNDCEFQTDDWLSTIVDLYNRNHMAVVSPYIEGLIDHPGGSPRLRNGWAGPHYVGVVEHLGGVCCFAPAHAYKDFQWKENDFLHGMQDSIFSMEMRRRGHVLLYLENVRVEHLFPTSPNYVDKENERPEDKEYRERRKIEKVTRFNG